MESYSPRYVPGDRVRLDDPATGWHDTPGTVVRTLTIAQQPHQSVRYLFEIQLDEHRIPVYVPEEVLAPDML